MSNRKQFWARELQDCNLTVHTQQITIKMCLQSDKARKEEGTNLIAIRVSFPMTLLSSSKDQPSCHKSSTVLPLVLICSISKIFPQLLHLFLLIRIRINSRHQYNQLCQKNQAKKFMPKTLLSNLCKYRLLKRLTNSLEKCLYHLSVIYIFINKSIE